MSAQQSRIRYKKKDNKLKSVFPVVSERTGARYEVYIDIDEMNYCIRNIQSLRKYEGGEGINNLNVLKRRVKKHLEQLGCVFVKETRNRTFGLCDKGTTQDKHVAKLREEGLI